MTLRRAGKGPGGDRGAVRSNDTWSLCGRGGPGDLVDEPQRLAANGTWLLLGAAAAAMVFRSAAEHGPARR